MANFTTVARLGAPQNIAFSTATNADTMLTPNFPETFLITPGQTVSALQVSASGVLSVTELS